MGERILIAGCGDIGSGLAGQLHAEGFSVTGLRRDVRRLPAGIAPFAADLGDPATLAPLGNRVFDCVVVCSTADRYDEASYRRVYVEGLGNLLDVLAGSPPLLLVSSTAVYHQRDGEWVDEASATEPTSFAGQVLLQAEELLRARAAQSSVVLRFGGIYGPGRERLLAEVREGIGCPREPVRYTNRIHREDCIGMLRFLVGRLREGTACAPLYLGVDDQPAPMWEVRHWLATQLGVRLDDSRGGTSARAPGSKRCSNRRIRASGYELRYPDYRAGYAPLLGRFRAAAPS